VPDPSALYPAPVNPANAVPSLLQNPLAAVGMMNQVQALRARNAIGGAFQGAIGPDGSFDPNAAALAIKNNPNAAYGAPEAIGSILDARRANIANSTAAYGLASTQSAGMTSGLAGLAADPDLSLDKVRNWAVTNGRMTGTDPSITNGWLAGLSSNPATLRNQLKGIGAAAAGLPGAGYGGARVNATTPQGQEYSLTPSEAVFAGQGTGGNAPTPPPRPQNAGAPPASSAAAAPGLQTGQPPNVVADQKAYYDDQDKSAATMANVRSLTQALPLAKQLSDPNFGPTSPGWTKAKTILAGLGIDIGNDATVARQEMGKYLLKYAANAQSAGRSDQALSVAMGSNPNADTMMKPAVLGLINNQVAMDTMDAAAPKIAGSSKDYKTFRQGYYDKYDLDAFKYALSDDPQQQQAILDAKKKNPTAYKKFVATLREAHGAQAIQPQQ